MVLQDGSLPLKPEVITTWHSLGRILAVARLVIPGHGRPIEVNRFLLEALLASFPNAEYYQDGPAVAELLRRRLTELETPP